MISKIIKIVNDYLDIIINFINSNLSRTQLVLIYVLLIYIINRALQYTIDSNDDDPNPNVTKFITNSIQYCSLILIIMIIYSNIIS